jgi:Domain of unknown function (DUF4351)
MREPEEQAKARALISRLLTRKVGALPEVVTDQINDLLPAQLDLLGEALLDFETLADLEGWLAQNLDRE